jgi:hypothetical protein
MTFKIRSFIWLPVLFATSACSTFLPSIHQESSPTPESKHFSGKPTSILLTTITPIPTATLPPTLSPPSPTLNQVSTSTPTPTPIPLETQLSIFENLWTIINDTYVYPDFNGLDWNVIHQEYRQKISYTYLNSKLIT